MTGLYFGSFNPIHIGHLIIAQYVLDETDCKEVWFVVSPQNPFKQNAEANAQQRLKMVQMAVSGNKKMKVCDAEFHLPMPSYTIHTLRYLQKKYPKKDFALIMGADNFSSLKKWKDGDQILKEFPILVYRRPGVKIKFQPEKNSRIHDSAFGVNEYFFHPNPATDQRKKISSIFPAGKSVAFYSA